MRINFAHPLFLSMITVGMWDRFDELMSRARSFRLDSFLAQFPNWPIMLGFYHYVVSAPRIPHISDIRPGINVAQGGIYFGLIVASRAVCIYKQIGLS